MNRNRKKKSMTVCMVLLMLFAATRIAACGTEKEYLETREERLEIRESGNLYLYLGEVTESLSPLCGNSIAGENLWSLCFSNLYRDSKEVFSEKMLSQFQKSDSAFHYLKEENQEENKTYLTVSINPALRTSFGTALTAEDIMFNYYLRTDPSICIAGLEQGAVTSFAGLIDGGETYYYGTGQVQERKNEIMTVLKNPDKTLIGVIRDRIVLPELYREYEWIEGLFEEDSDKNLTGGYQSAAEMFVHFYAYRTQYSGKGKTKEIIISEIAGQYGGNYHALERVTGRSYENLAEKLALYEVLKKQGKDVVKEIGGIKKLSEKTVQITFLGIRIAEEKMLNIWILPFQTYKNDTEHGDVMFQKGDAAEAYEKTKKILVGSGSYYCTDFGTNRLCLRSSRHYFEGEGKIEKLYVLRNQRFTVQELFKKLLDRELDFAVTQTDAHLEEMLQNRETGAIYKLNLYPVGEENWGIMYRTDYLNRTTFPKNVENLSEMFRKIYQIKVNR